MVADAARRMGVGTALMAHAERRSRTRCAGYVALATRRAGDFYLTLGYEDSAVYYRKMLI
jgi:GNAT superfamily N-acetyltransferase